MSKTNVYVVTHLDIYEHNVGTFSTLTAPKVCWSLEEAQEEMKALARKGLAALDFEMDGDSEEAVLNCGRFEKVFTMPAFKEANGMKFGRPVIKAPPNFPEIVEKWENGIIKAYEAAEMCGMCESTFYHRLREYRATLNSEK